MQSTASMTDPLPTSPEPTSEPTVPQLHLLDHDVRVIAQDEPGPGGAYHRYLISVLGDGVETIDPGSGAMLVTRTPHHQVVLQFQKGGKQEAGANGITNEALLAIVQHRLACFQAGKFPCKENAAALKHLESAIDWLQRRTSKRRTRGVEGKSVP